MSKPILLIDDEEVFARMLQDLLKLNGFESEYCLNPREALERLSHENYDLVITDYMMPELDGAQFLKATREVHPDLPVIMISGLMNIPELIRVANIGVTLVLEKPFKTDELLESVGRYVNARSPEELADQALDMEASEIDFQPGECEYSYPSPAQVIADATEESKRFLESLWKNASLYRHIAFFAPKGAEIRLLGTEMMTWLEEDSEEEPVRIDLRDTNSEINREWILNQKAVSRILMVDGRQCAWDEETLHQLVDWVEFIEGSGKDLSLTRILYILPMGASLDVENLPLEASLKTLFATECPVLLSLRERLPDIVVYIDRFFSSGEKEAIGSNVLRRLLHYSWPGGYIELLKTMNAIRAKIETGIVVTGEVLKTQILQNSLDPDSLEGSLDLYGYLTRRQREYLMLHREPDEEFRDTLLRLGIEAREVDIEAVLQNEILIYPEILKDNDGQG